MKKLSDAASWLVAGLALIVPALIDTPVKYYTDIITGPLIVFILIYIFSFRYSSLKRVFTADSAAMWFFAVSMTAMSLAYPRTTEIPEMRMISRSLYYIYIIVYLLFNLFFSQRAGSLHWPMLTLFLFGSFVNSSLSEAAVFPVFYYAAWLFLRSRSSGNMSEFSKGHLIFFAAAFAALITVNILATNPLKAGNSLLRWSAGLLVFFSLFRAGREDVLKILNSLSIYFIILFIYFAGGMFFLSQVKGEYIPVLTKWNFIAGINTNDMGAVFLFILSFFTGLALYSKNQSKQSFYFFGAAALLALIFLVSSHSRTAFPLPAVMLAGFLYLYLIEKRSYRIVNIYYLIILIASVLLVSHLLSFSSVSERIMNDTTILTRRIQWTYAWNAFLKKPLTGWGGDNSSILLSFPVSIIKNPDLLNFINENRKYLTVSHAHNTYLQLLMEGGMIYFSVFIWGIIFLFRNSVAEIIKTKDYILGGIALGLIIYLIHGLLNYSLFLYPVMIIIMTASGLLYTIAQKTESNHQDFTRRIINGMIALVTIISLWYAASFSFFRSAISEVRSSVYWNAYHDYTLFSSVLPYSGLSEKELIPFINKMENHRKISIASTPADILLGDAYFIKFINSGEENDLNKAYGHYSSAAKGKENKAYAYRRLGDICEKYINIYQESGDTEKYRYFIEKRTEYFAESNVNDPFYHLSRKFVRLYQ